METLVEPPTTRAGFEALYRATYPQVYRFLYRRVSSDHEDIAAEVFLIAWRKRTEIPNPALPWLYNVAAKVLSNTYRSTARRANLTVKVHAQPPPIHADHADSVASNVTAQQQVAELFEKLPDADVEILRLWAWEQLSHGDIATALNISKVAARARLSRARKRAAALLPGTSRDGVIQLFSA